MRKYGSLLEFQLFFNKNFSGKYLECGKNTYSRKPGVSTYLASAKILMIHFVLSFCLRWPKQGKGMTVDLTCKNEVEYGFPDIRTVILFASSGLDSTLASGLQNFTPFLKKLYRN
jgi:hypothetical protein